MIVIDAGAAIAASLGQVDENISLRDELAAPHLIDSEVLNGLRNLVLRAAITAEDGERAVSIFAQIEIERYPAAWLRKRIWELRHCLTAYDATYVALTERLDADRLLTTDARLSRAPGIRCSVAVV